MGGDSGSPRLLAHPRAARRLGGPERLERLARRVGLRPEFPEHARAVAEIARTAARSGAERIVVAGGDGTICSAIEGLCGTPCGLGIVPLGTGNDLARSLSLPRDPAEALRVAATGPRRTIDLGRAGSRLFATVAGAGLHGAVAARVGAGGRRPRGPLVYPLAVLAVLASYRPPRIRVEYDAGMFEDRAWMAVLANTESFGGGMRIAPGARPDDGCLELVILRDVSRPTLLRLLPAVYRGRHVRHAAVLRAPTRRAALSLDPAQGIWGDGEPFGVPAGGATRFETLPGALSVVVPDAGRA